MVSVLSSYYEKFLATGEVKCIDEEIPFEIPSSWEWCRLGSIAEIIGGYAFPSHTLKGNQGTRVIRISDITENGFTNSRLVRYNGSPVSDIYRIQKFDILMAMTGGTVGKSLFVKSMSEDMLLNQRVAIIRNRHICADYLNLVIKAPHIASVISDRKNSTNDNISMVDIYDFFIPVPPIENQKRIVTKYNELLPLVNKYGHADHLAECLNNGIKDKLRKSILQEAIQGRLVPQIAEEGTVQELLEQIKQEKAWLVKGGKLKKSALQDSVIFRGDDNKYYEQIGTEIIDITDEIPFEIPKNWIWTRLKNFCSVCTGATFKKEEVESEHCGIRVLRGGNIKPFQLCTKPDDIFIPQSKVKEDILLKHNDIVTPAVTSLENIGKMAIVELDMPHTTVGGFVFIIRPLGGGESLSKYLLAFMSSPSAIDFMKSITNKSGQAFYNIGKERLVTALVPIPPLAEQERIVSKIEKLFEQLR